MSTYKYPKVSDEYASQFPQIDAKELGLMWHLDYWDGALSGMIMYKNKAHWFQLLVDDYEKLVTDENGEKTRRFVRRFMLLELSEEQYQEELHWHNLFREKVGSHTDYDENGRRNTGSVKPREMWDEYYHVAKNRTQDFGQNKIVGWFEW